MLTNPWDTMMQDTISINLIGLILRFSAKSSFFRHINAFLFSNFLSKSIKILSKSFLIGFLLFIPLSFAQIFAFSFSSSAFFSLASLHFSLVVAATFFLVFVTASSWAFLTAAAAFLLAIVAASSSIFLSAAGAFSFFSTAFLVTAAAN